VRAAALLLALAAGCGADYWVWRDARPSSTGWIAARRDPDGAVFAIRPDQVREVGGRGDGARAVTARFRNSNAFAAGVSLFGCGLPLVGVSIAFAVIAANPSNFGSFDRDIAVTFGVIGGAATLAGSALGYFGWPIRLRAEPLAAHPDVVAAPPSLASPLPPTP
jgi:hypothetical protein